VHVAACLVLRQQLPVGVEVHHLVEVVEVVGWGCREGSGLGVGWGVGDRL
jgi:hypothetical protein